ncbi:hypothetical protein AVEN_182327-1 [Araneus ventricosus]|uniref:Uncharacterized protein n=1 Tax=Araneus ventricosus TaxID=182803 RepID=A0A4Y2KB97_ARAVE|nr:hypothetical protein AVEN_182327-1 [Araneus ventricosus]
MTRTYKLTAFDFVMLRTYSSQIWGITAKTDREKIQTLQNKILRVMTNASWFVRNDVIHEDIQIEICEEHTKKLPRKFFQIADHKNPLISNRIEFAHNNGKHPNPFCSTKWSLPLKPS